jgi:hypothetical protein
MARASVTRKNPRPEPRNPFGLDLHVQTLETDFGSMMERTYVWTSKHGNPTHDDEPREPREPREPHNSDNPNPPP